MRIPTHLGLVLVALVTARHGDTRTAQPPAQAPPDPGIPTGRVCALQDLGKPSSARGRRSMDPIGFQELGLMVEDPNGDLVTTSPYGGRHYKGSIVRFDRSSGAVTVLFSFDGGKLGEVPVGGLTDGTDGYFYGTTSGGGDHRVGTIFRVPASGGAPKDLYHFRNGRTAGLDPPQCPPGPCLWPAQQVVDISGGYPRTAPVLGPRGSLFGVTPYSNNQQYGVLYRIDPPYDSTTYRTLCVFNPGLGFHDARLTGYICDSKATRPLSIIVGDGGTALYGTTVAGYGTLFRASLGGHAVTTLHEFTPATGYRPSGLVQASGGMLYGTAYAGGAVNAGVVYRLDPATRTYTVLTSFLVGKTTMAMRPLGGLVLGHNASGTPDGYLYGATQVGGSERRGTLYRIKLDGTDLKLLYQFSEYQSGMAPLTAPFQHKSGAYYGLTSLGGSYGSGVLYKLTEVDLPVVKTHPARFYPGKPAKNDAGVLLKDDLVRIRSNVAVRNYLNKVVPKTDDGIMITAVCRNPHFVQFFSREKITTLKHYLSGTATTSSGTYQLTIDPLKPNWHTDALGRPNAYFDQSPGAVWSLPYAVRGTATLTIFDQPQFNPPLFDPADQADPTTSQTWRGVAKVYVICNCNVVREVRWTIEIFAGKQKYKEIDIRPADHSALAWINAQLQRDQFRPVP